MSKVHIVSISKGSSTTYTTTSLLEPKEQLDEILNSLNSIVTDYALNLSRNDHEPASKYAERICIEVNERIAEFCLLKLEVEEIVCDAEGIEDASDSEPDSPPL